MNSPVASGPGAGQRRWQLPADVSGFVGRSGELGQLAGVAVSTTERVLKDFRMLGIIATRYGATE